MNHFTMLCRTIPADLPNWPQVKARVIIERDVDLEIEAYRKRQGSGNVLWLDLPSLRAALASCEARPGSRDLPGPDIDPAFARRAAAEALADGVVLMFVDGVRITEPEQPVTLRDDSSVRYLRLHAQRGI